MNNAVLSAPGDRIVHTIGRITITLQFVRDSAYTVTTEQGGTYRIQELCTAHRDEQTARARARSIAAALKDGVSVEQLIGSVQAAQADVLAAADAILDEALAVAVADPRTVAAEPTITALQAAKTDDADELAARIRADLDRAEADRKARQAALNNDIAEIMANSAGLRGDYRQVRNTRSHVFTKPLSAPQRAAIRTHTDGIVRLGRGVTRPMLRAIADKGYGTLAEVPGMGRRKVISHLMLNDLGLAEAGQAAAA